MREVLGIWLPDGDDHFPAQLAAGPVVGGKATYQWKKYQAALKHVGRRLHAVDIGGHVGLWSRVMAMDFANVTAFEPVKAHRECFELNAPDVPVLPYALGAKAGTVWIATPAGNTGNAHISEAGEECKVLTLDSVALDPIDFLKVDVEGFEYDVLVGGEQTIRRDRPVIVVEQKPGHAQRYGRGQWDAVGLLLSWGMRQADVISGDHVMVW